MFDYDKELYFCICGKKIEQEGTCGELKCVELFDSFKNQIEQFFTVLEEQGPQEGFKLFETLKVDLQIAIFFELEDELMLLYLQGLGQEKVLELLELGNDALRYRLLELLEPLLEKELIEEYKNLQDTDREDVKELLLYILDIILQSVQKLD